MKHALGILIKGLAFILALSIGGALLFFGSIIWSNSNRDHDYYACQMRAMEHKITGVQADAYQNICMAAAGYRLNGECVARNLAVTIPSYCYVPRWRS